MSFERGLDVDLVASEGLEMLGYKQQMTRSRGLFHTLFMSLAIMAVPYGLAAPIATSLIGGGPATMIWGWITVAFFSQCLAFSLGEICSKYPTSAGAYYWCFRLASPKRRVLLSWIDGWLTLVGVWMASLGVLFGAAQLIVAAVGIYHHDWIASPLQTYLIFCAVLVVASFPCIFMNDYLPIVDILCAVWTVLGTLVILVCLSVNAAAGRHSVAFAVGHFDPSPSGWSPGWTFFVGLLPSALTYSSIGMVTSMAEEVHNPSVDLPKAIIWSVPIGCVCGLAFLLPIVFTLPDVGTLLRVSSGQPIGLMFELIMGSKVGGFWMVFIILGIAIFCAISVLCAASRATWAFARDHAIPFHHIFSRINTQLSAPVPLNAFLLSATIQLLLGLIHLGSSAAFNAFVGVTVVCLGASYAMPLAISLCNGRKDMEDAPVRLGRWGFAVNGGAVVWVVFEIVLFSMPGVVPVTKVSMNYTSVVFVGFGVVSGVWYLMNGRFHYVGPPTPGPPSATGESEGAGEFKSSVSTGTQEEIKSRDVRGI